MSLHLESYARAGQRRQPAHAGFASAAAPSTG